MNRHLPMIRARVLDALRTPVETRCTDNSMPWQNWAKYDKPSRWRRLTIYVRRKKLDRRFL